MGVSKIRSDCKFEIQLKKSGGLTIEINSKVDSMYGKSIKKQITEMCRFFEIKNANIYMEDKGALPFVIAARFECSLKKIIRNNQKEFLLPLNNKNKVKTTKDRMRRSRLYLPGNEIGRAHV